MSYSTIGVPSDRGASTARRTVAGSGRMSMYGKLSS